MNRRLPSPREAAVQIPATEFVKVGDARVAYQVFGDGPVDLVISSGTWSHVDVSWEDPVLARFREGLARFARVILFDRRGIGASDPLPDQSRPWWEFTMEDMTAILDEVGSDRPAFYGHADGAAPVLAFAAAKPERVPRVILSGAMARYWVAPDYPIGLPRSEYGGQTDWYASHWGTQEGAAAYALRLAAGRADDPAFIAWLAKYQRAVTSTAGLMDVIRDSLQYDMRGMLASIRCPTLVLWSESHPDLDPVPFAEYLAERIPEARLELFPGSDFELYHSHMPKLLSTFEEFLTGEVHAPVSNRVLATVLFTDIVGSTQQVVALGDRTWLAKLERHDAISAATVGRFGGRLVKTTGDGMMATFDGPGRAIACAQSLLSELASVDLTIRAGVHTGEIERQGDGGVGGIAVHIGARIMDLASPGEVLASRTVRDLVFGSDITFEARGTHALKGVPDEWELVALVRSRH